MWFNPYTCGDKSYICQKKQHNFGCHCEQMKKGERNKREMKRYVLRDEMEQLYIDLIINL